ncbi:MAG: hypothetical protein AAB532_00640 [Patescibacteria group bacterium]
MKKILFLTYSFFLVFISFFSYLFLDPNLTYLHNFFTGFSYSNRGIITLIYTAIVFLFFVFYILFVKLLNKGVLVRKDILILIGISALGLLFSYPAMVSYDIFNYVATAKVSFYYFENPYLLMPIQFLNDPLLLFMQAANKTALYGPFWIMLTSIPFLLGFGQFILILFNFKFFIFVFYLLTTYLLNKLNSDVKNLIIFALNPLVLFELFVGGHNDIVMMFLVILSFYLLKNKKILLALVFLTLSIFIKFASLFLLPIIIYIVIQNIKKREISWDKVFVASSILMFTVFLLSTFREEIYPWYGIWFLAFTPLFKNKLLKGFYLALSFGLLLRYIPYMYLATYLSPTPLIKTILMITPVILYLIYMIVFRKLKLRVKK